MSDHHSRPASGAAVVALNIHEILCQIFEVDSNVGKDRRFLEHELLSCALVSRAFCEPVLRSLWGHMSSPTPLWRLLAATGTHSGWINNVDFFDTVYPQILSERTYADPARWTRFTWYARFVKELRIMLNPREHEHKKLVQALVEHNGGETIFPSMQTLWWPPSTYSDSSYFVLFTPRLRSVSVDFHECMLRNEDHPDQDPQSHIFLARLHTSSPRLHHLSVSTPLKRVGTNHSHAIALFGHLTNLHLLARISFASFRELVTMPNMQCICIFHVSSDVLDPSHPPARVHAPRLASLAVGGTLPSLTQLLVALDAPSLASATVQAMWDGPPRTLAHGYVDYVPLIEALATVPSPASLTDITIEFDEDGGPRMCEWLVDLLAPLLAFHKIARFSLTCPTIGLVARDDDFWLISGAWPRLRAFELCRAFWDPCVDPDDDDDDGDDGDDGQGSEGIPGPTPQVLECFREDCPDLAELRLPHLDVHADVPGLFTYVGKRRDHALGRLWFGEEEGEGSVREPDADAELGDEKVAEWARYILHLFPDLNAEESLKYCCLSEAAFGWMEVLEQVRHLQRKSKEGSESGGAVAMLSRRRCI